ncbi:NAD(P)/FAD-dependent oxidoreductase [Streptomyces sp. NBC_01304]|uniref:NAD(P)/FAD-dependent oxidoreductase n=1 Tax=Streptomyces sp. NBC_01304 TaxID=2903818 RepID=UPI002E0DEA93|nr:FAD-dependent oxidoreductase [Streptomyces sp. NBC_01304]
MAVIGAGPAGLAGAVAAGQLGLRVALVDAAEQTGGQFYRHPAPGLRARRPEALHHDWAAYAQLRDRLAATPSVTHLPAHHVWSVVRDGDHFAVHALTGADGTDRTPVVLRARVLLLSTGAVERQLPFPGWTLPGVITAGGAQAMLKSGLVLPGRRIVVAGSGPLLLAAATSLAAAGAEIPAVVEAAGYPGYARHLRALAANPGKLTEALTHGSALLRHRIPLRSRSAVVAAHGTHRVEAVTVARLDRDWRPIPGTARRIPCDAVAVGHGLVAQTDLGTALGCATRRSPDGTHALDTGPDQETSVPGVWTAGESCGIGGASAARAEGELAGIAAATRLTAQPPDSEPLLARSAKLRRRITRMRTFAEAMAAVHAPAPGWTAWLTDDTEVCRCEEVTAARIREATAELGARDARTVKLLTRAGMGWCQGRMCSAAVACLSGAGPAPDRRPLASPVPLAALADLPAEATEAS